MIRYIVKYIFFLLLHLLLNCVTSVQAGTVCDPVVDNVQVNSTVSQTLSSLAEKYNFSLTFPKDIDRQADVGEMMRLSQLVKFLTWDMNTVLRHEKVDGCVSPILTELIVLSVGEDTEYVIVEKKPVLIPQQVMLPAKKPGPAELFDIDDMEQYVTQVLMRERKSNVKNMTAEQKKEFKEMKQLLRVELRDEISEIRKSRKPNRKKE